MNKILTLILFLIPLISLSQSESDEKVQKRSNRNNNIENGRPVFVNPRPSVIYPYTNYYNPYNPYIYSGYRGNTYYSGNRQLNDNRLEASIGFISSLGIEEETPSLGLYFTLGGRRFLYFSFESTKENPYEHYDNITYQDVVSWNDERLGEFTQYTSFNVGIGTEVFNSVSHFGAINFYTKDIDSIYFDEFYILSNDGKYSINHDDKNSFNLVYGFLIDIRRINLGSSFYFLNDNRASIHLGFTF